LLTYNYEFLLAPDQTTVAPNNNDNSFDFDGAKTMSTTYSSSDYTGGMSGGLFTYKYFVCISGSSPPNCVGLDIPQLMVDPCNPPTSIVQPALTNQEYTIVDLELSYTHDDYTVDPAYCDVAVTYT